ncbi:MAG: alpha/beta hydrolase [Pseudomonadota bacterium]
MLAVLLLALTGCAGLSLQARWHHAEQLAARADWHKLRLPTDTFILSAYVPKQTVPTDTLTVYIEGDGLAWLNRSQPARDPTPRNPVALELALRHPRGAAAYLARPCQYVEAADAKNCRETYWTAGRFAAPVIEASSQAIDALKQRAGASRLVLVGYSGGGTVAALVAARRGDVDRLVTVAGNLDHRAWTEMQGLPALAESLNPADEWRALQALPQRHFVGGRDNTVGRRVTESYLARFPPDRRPEVVTLPDFDHVCCWVERWDSIGF